MKKYTATILVVITFALIVIARNYLESGKAAPLLGLVASPSPTPITAISTIDQSKEVEQSLLRMMNGIRQETGLAPLVENAQLTKGAQQRAEALKNSKQWSHDQWLERINDTGYEWENVGENIAAEYPGNDPYLIMDGWLQSYWHEFNILAPEYKDVGIGVYKDHIVVWFGQPKQ